VNFQPIGRILSCAGAFQENESMNLGELAEKLGCKLEGEPQTEIFGVAGIEAAGPGDITFLANPRYTHMLSSTNASAVLIDENTPLERDADAPPLAALRSSNPYLDFARTIDFFFPPPAHAPGTHPTAVIAKTAKIGADSYIGPYCIVGEDVEIGRNAFLHSLVTIYRGAHIGDNFFAHSQCVVREDCQIGNRVILQNGVVIGGDGFGFAKRADGTWQKISQQAPVVIEDDVEIQSNACIDRATVGETRIRRGAKIDDLVLVGHACEVGEDAILCGQVGLAGSTQIGKRVIMAGQSAAAGHLKIGDGAIITSQSGVHNSVDAGTMRSGTPDIDNKLWLKVSAAMKRLPEMQKKLRDLSEEIQRLKRAAE
jgi:UDP-3-O-[3-hydroxymyristoyl] glucosamine N-acyltransferase